MMPRDPQTMEERLSVLNDCNSRFRHVTFAGETNVSFAPSGDAPAERAPSNLGSAGDGSGESIHADEMAFVDWLFAQARVNAADYRPQTLGRRLPACLRLIRAANCAHARAMIERNPSLLWPAVGAVIIGVTSFFRDAGVFASIESTVLPRLIERSAGGVGFGAVPGGSAVARRTGAGIMSAIGDDRGTPIRVWSAGCSDGAELYSIAMLLAERQALHRCSLLGTDCRLDATRCAARARFAAAQVERDIPPHMIDRYFSLDEADAAGNSANDSPSNSTPGSPKHPGTPGHFRSPGHFGSPGHYHVRPFVAARMEWRTADLLRVPEPGPWDLILCRNLAMYLRADAAARLWTMLESSLRPGGFLVLGKAERPSGAARLSLIAPCVYRRSC